MKTRTTEVTPVYVEAICAECGQSINRGDYAYASNPYQYGYICETDGCVMNGKEVISTKAYPRIDFVTKDGRVVG